MAASFERTCQVRNRVRQSRTLGSYSVNGIRSVELSRVPRREAVPILGGDLIPSVNAA